MSDVVSDVVSAGHEGGGGGTRWSEGARRVLGRGVRVICVRKRTKSKRCVHVTGERQRLSVVRVDASNTLLRYPLSRTVAAACLQSRALAGWQTHRVLNHDLTIYNARSGVGAGCAVRVVETPKSRESECTSGSTVVIVWDKRPKRAEADISKPTRDPTARDRTRFTH